MTYPIQSCVEKTYHPAAFALRLGFRQIKGFRRTDADALVAARQQGDFATMEHVWRSMDIDRHALAKLTKGDAMGSVGLNRRAAEWAAMGLEAAPLPLFAAAEAADAVLIQEPAMALPPMSMGEEVTEDYRHLHLSLKQHPLALVRDALGPRGIVPNRRLKAISDGKRVQVAGIVLVRQQPGTASGVIFMTIEDETGVANIIVWPRIFERFRAAVLGSRLLGVQGRVQRDESGQVIHVVAERLSDLSFHLAALAEPPAPADAPPFDTPLARADEGRHAPGTSRRGQRHRMKLPASRDFR